MDNLIPMSGPFCFDLPLVLRMNAWVVRITIIKCQAEYSLYYPPSLKTDAEEFAEDYEVIRTSPLMKALA